MEVLEVNSQGRSYRPWRPQATLAPPVTPVTLARLRVSLKHACGVWGDASAVCCRACGPTQSEF